MTKKENRNGLELEITELPPGIQRTVVKNWRPDLGEVLTFYTDEEMRGITGLYTPGIVHDNDNGLYSKVGVAFPKEERILEQVVHPLVAISANWQEFGGVDLENHERIVPWANYFSQRINPEFESITDTRILEEAAKAGYVRIREIEGKQVYFPTEKAVRAMCNLRTENMLFALALHTGVNMGTGHKKVSPEYSD